MNGNYSEPMNRCKRNVILVEQNSRQRTGYRRTPTWIEELAKTLVPNTRYGAGFISGAPNSCWILIESHRIHHRSDEWSAARGRNGRNLGFEAEVLKTIWQRRTLLPLPAAILDGPVFQTASPHTRLYTHTGESARAHPHTHRVTHTHTDRHTDSAVHTDSATHRHTRSLWHRRVHTSASCESESGILFKKRERRYDPVTPAMSLLWFTGSLLFLHRSKESSPPSTMETVKSFNAEVGCLSDSVFHSFIYCIHCIDWDGWALLASAGVGPHCPSLWLDALTEGSFVVLLQLSSLYDVKPPISKAKMTAITKGAIKAVKFYKHVVQSVEKFLQKVCPHLPQWH